MDLNQLPEPKGRSKLAAHRDLIARLRMKRHTYRQIAAYLKEHFGIRVAASTIHNFVRVRSQRPRKQFELPPQCQSPVPALPAVVDVRARIEAFQLRQQRAAPHKPKFEYTEGEPLILMPETEKEQK
jgi:hypothetical protein